MGPLDVVGANPAAKYQPYPTQIVKRLEGGGARALGEAASRRVPAGLSGATQDLPRLAGTGG